MLRITRAEDDNYDLGGQIEIEVQLGASSVDNAIESE